jgi:hypothetical protein
MTTKTTQSSAILAQREKSAPNSILPRSWAANLLIANARLEFIASHSKHNLLKISNRERITIFHPPFCVLAEKGTAATRPSKRRSSFHPRASSRQILIANLELEFLLTHRKLRPLEISNRKYFAISYIASATKPRARSIEKRFAATFVTKRPRKYVQRSGTAQGGEECCAVWAAEAGAGVPAGASGVGSIVPGCDVMKCGFGFRGIQKWS